MLLPPARASHGGLKGSGHRVLTAKGGPPLDRGLVRERLVAVLALPVVLVTAPAGHGKSTLLAQLADSFPGPVVWYRLDGDDRGAGRLLARLGAALLTALRGRADTSPASVPEILE